MEEHDEPVEDHDGLSWANKRHDLTFTPQHEHRDASRPLHGRDESGGQLNKQHRPSKKQQDQHRLVEANDESAEERALQLSDDGYL